MPEDIYSEKHFFNLASQDLIDSKCLFDNGSFRNGLHLMCTAEEKIAKGLLCDIGFIQDKSDIQRSKKAVEKYPLDEQVRTQLLKILDAMERQAPEDKRKMMKKYGHSWHLEFVNLLSSISETVDNMMMVSDLLSTMEAPKHAVSALWHTGDFKQRTEALKDTLRDSAKFMNPPLEQLDAVIASDNDLLSNIPPFRLSPEETQTLYERLFGGAPLPIERIQPGALEGQIKRTFKLTVIGDMAVYLAPHYEPTSYLDLPIDFKYDEGLAVIRRRKEMSALMARCLND